MVAWQAAHGNPTGEGLSLVRCEKSNARIDVQLCL